MKLSKDTQRKFALINALSELQKPSLHDLHRATLIPESTIKRQFGFLRDEYGMTIHFERELTGERGATGHYMLLNWGIIDRAKFILKYGAMIESKSGSKKQSEKKAPAKKMG